MPRARTPLALLMALGLTVTVASCGGSGDDSKPSPQAGATTASSTPSPSARPTPPPRSPLTGLPGVPEERVIALKVDNGLLARPFQVGLDKADVVYEELAEAGVTRFLAIFASKPVAKIGPVRSVRESDLELLKQYGRVLFGFSGGNKGVLRSVARADVVDVSYDISPRAYDVRMGQRRDAYNFYTSTSRLRAARSEGVTAKDIGLRFGAGSPSVLAAPAATTMAVAFSDTSRTSYAYEAGTTSWVRSQNGKLTRMSDGALLKAANVVVQYVSVRPSQYTDVNGERTPNSITVGRGKVDVFRDGKRVTGTWQRGTAAAPTRLIDATGKDIPLRAGTTHVLLVPSNAALSVS